MGVGEFRGGKGGGVKWTEHLFLMLCTFKDNTTYLIQFQINYILYPTDHVYKKICKRSAETPLTATTSPISVQCQWLPPPPPTSSFSIHGGTHIIHYIYIDIHRYLPLPVLLAHHSVRGHWCWGIPQSWGFPPHIHTGPILPGAISVFSQHWRLLPMHCEPRWIKKVLPCWNLAACKETHSMLIQTICLSMMSTWFRY